MQIVHPPQGGHPEPRVHPLTPLQAPIGGPRLGASAVGSSSAGAGLSVTPVPRRVAAEKRAAGYPQGLGWGVGGNAVSRGARRTGSHRQELVAHQAQVPLPQGSGAQQHPAVPAEMPAFSQHQHHPGERAAVQVLCPGRQGRLSHPFPLPLGRVSGSGLRGSLTLGTGPGRVWEEGVLGPHGKHRTRAADTQQEVWRGEEKGPLVFSQSSTSPAHSRPSGSSPVQ